MTTFSKLALSNSVNGKNINIGSITSTTPTIIHTTQISNTIIDEVWLYAINIDSADHILLVQFGGITVPDTIPILIPAYKGAILVIPGWILTGNNTAGLNVSAYIQDTINTVVVSGYINRIQ